MAERRELTDLRHAAGCGLTLPNSLTFERWSQLGAFLITAENNVQWWLGDWLNYGERRWGDKYKEALQVTGRPYGTLRNYKSIASTFDLSRRRDKLTWNHHATVAASENADILLERAEKEKLSVKDLRQLLAQDRPKRFTRAAGSSQQCTLIEASVAELSDRLDAESVDVILTDPPYSDKYLNAYEDLASLAIHVLRPGGSLLVMTGQFYLPKVITALDGALTYHWTVAYLTPGGQSPQIWPRKINTFWKPVLWFVKEGYEDDWIGDVVHSDVNDNDKRFHDWGQSESGTARLVERFTREGDIILDPFLGGGTTGEVALALNRRFIGADADSEAVKTATKRLDQ